MHIGTESTVVTCNENESDRDGLRFRAIVHLHT